MKEHNLQHVQNVIAVAAGKGGVGKSTVALNLALCLQKKGKSVGVMDADLYGPSLKKMLPATVLPAQHPEIPDRILPAEGSGIKMISMAYFLSEEDPASVRAPIANGIIKQFIHLVEWGALDYLIIDFPPGTGDIQLTLMQEGALSGAVLVTTPQEIALLDVAKAMVMFQQMQVPLIGIIENMSYYYLTDVGQKIYPFGEEGGRRFAEQKGQYFLGQIPIERAISVCCDTGQSLFEIGEPVVHVFEQITAQVEEQLVAFTRLQGPGLKNVDFQWN